MRFVTSELLGLQVNDHSAERVGHTLKSHELLETGGNLADLTISNVDLFTVELLGIRVGPDLGDLANTDVALRNVGDDLDGGLRGRLLVLLGLLLLLGLVSVVNLLLLLTVGLGLLLLLLFGGGVLRLLLRSGTRLFLLLGILGGLELGELLQLGLGGTLSSLVGEADKEALGLDLLEHAGQVLQVVHPSVGALVRQS